MCDSAEGDFDCEMLEVESQPECFCCFGRAMPADGQSVQFSECDYVCSVCEPEEEEIATIHLDASRLVLPLADEAGEAETQQVAYYFLRSSSTPSDCTIYWPPDHTNVHDTYVL